MRGRGHEAPLGREGLADGHQGALRDEERHDHGAQDPERPDDEDGQEELPLEAMLERQVHAGLQETGRRGGGPSSSSSSLSSASAVSSATRMVRSRTSVSP